MNLNGLWFNELGSAMELTVNGKVINGVYRTAVGDASGEYNLIGFTDIDGDKSQSLGFVVLWNNDGSGSSDSVTTWSGQGQLINGEETIVTTWLLTEETNPNDDWHSTLINKDTFTRVSPTQEIIKKNLAKGAKESFPSAVRK